MKLDVDEESVDKIKVTWTRRSEDSEKKEKEADGC
jgi:hypothetical protein